MTRLTIKTFRRDIEVPKTAKTAVWGRYDCHGYSISLIIDDLVVANLVPVDENDTDDLKARHALDLDIVENLCRGASIQLSVELGVKFAGLKQGRKGSPS